MSQLNYRTINVDVLDPESSINFPLDTLLPGTLPAPTDSNTAAGVASQVRQMLRGGDPEGALRYVLDTAPLGGDDRAKEVHLSTVIEVLQGIRQGEMTRILEAVCAGEGGSERADCLMKYMYVSLSSSPFSLESCYGGSWLTMVFYVTLQLQRHGSRIRLERRGLSLPPQGHLPAAHGHRVLPDPVPQPG